MRYGAILADPPWRFETYDGKKALPGIRAEDHYPTMTRDELLALQLPAATDCALFMWYSGTHTDQALALGAAWGFTFVRSEVFVWIKAKEGQQPRIGAGYYSRNGAECCALFKRGAPKVLAHDVEQVIFTGRGAHSAKPEEQYRRIERLVGGPYLELFARSSWPGWSTWGNEAGVRDGLFDGKLGGDADDTRRRLQGLGGG